MALLIPSEDCQDNFRRRPDLSTASAAWSSDLTPLAPESFSLFFLTPTFDEEPSEPKGLVHRRDKKTSGWIVSNPAGCLGGELGI